MIEKAAMLRALDQHYVVVLLVPTTSTVSTPSDRGTVGASIRTPQPRCPARSPDRRASSGSSVNVTLSPALIVAPITRGVGTDMQGALVERPPPIAMRDEAAGAIACGKTVSHPGGLPPLSGRLDPDLEQASGLVLQLYSEWSTPDPADSPFTRQPRVRALLPIESCWRDRVPSRT